MKVTFHIEYYTTDGLYIRFGRGAARRMHSVGDGQWTLQTELSPQSDYHYEVHNALSEVVRVEEFTHRVEGDGRDVEIFDRWWDKSNSLPFYSTLFTDGIFRRVSPMAAVSAQGDSILVEVEATEVRSDERVAIVGEHPLLGGWDAAKAVVMSDAAAPLWRARVKREVAESEYKFIVIDAVTRRLKRYEQGENRRMPVLKGDCGVVRGLRIMGGVEPWRGAGVAIPLFSLRSDKDWGVGEFSDLKLLADWAVRVGISVIQTLPVNDTTSSHTWRDSYPYNACSSFALHPLYIDPQQTVEICSRSADAVVRRQMRELLARYATKGARLNQHPAVDYDAAILLKERFLREVYRLCGEAVLRSRRYAAFARQSEEWLTPYAIYCDLRDRVSPFPSAWGEMAVYDKQRALQYARRNARRIGFYAFVQYLLDRQLTSARDYAHSKGITLKGDIPIGVSPTSVDVWRAPELYNLDSSAGAPPDAFAEEGQNWGFPTYNWARMREDGYAWWCARLRKMARYFDAYRIDHILGFFRIWEVPRAQKSAILGHFNPSLPYTEQEILSFGFDFDPALHAINEANPRDVLFLRYPYAEGYTPRIEGYKCEMYKRLGEEQQRAYMRLHEDFYYHRHNDFWRDNALRRLPALMGATRMLTCGEDLGMIPACVPEVMAEERVLSLEIERMPKQMGVAFGDVRRYPYLSVAATSTHDMSTIRGWWREDAALAQRYWNEVLGQKGVAERECSGATAERIVERHMRSSSMLAILPLQDWLAIDERLRLADPDAERINIPANPSHYWRWRMHLPLEQLLAEEEFNKRVRELVALR